MHELTTSTEAAFLIVVRDALVGQDLSLTIADDRPQAKVIVVATVEDAVSALAGIAAIDIAFVAAEPEDFESSPLAGCLAACGAQVVLMGILTDSPSPTAGWKMLPFPFTTEDVRGLIAACQGNQMTGPAFL